MRSRADCGRLPIFSLTCALAAVLVLAAPLALPAQSPAADAATSGAALPPALRVAVDRLADSARAQGVPVEPLYLKAAEGVLKGASDDRIALVVGRLLAELREARRGLGTRATSAELVAGANVIHAGMDVGTLQRVSATRTRDRSESSLVMRLVVLADLVARHVTPETATAAITALAERGAADQELASLRSVVEREISRGQPPDAATRARTADILRGISGDGRQDVLPLPPGPRTHP